MIRNKVNVLLLYFFFFNDTATTEIYTLSLHDALPILLPDEPPGLSEGFAEKSGQAWRTFLKRISFGEAPDFAEVMKADRKSTRLNSSHANISYAVFCLKKKTCATPTFFCAYIKATFH